MSDRRPVSAARLCLLAGVLVLVLLASPVQAEEPGGQSLDLSAALASKDGAPRPEPSRTAYVPTHTSRFVTSVNMQMEALSTFTKTAVPGTAMQDNVMYSEHTRAVERTLLRTTRRAFRDYLMEVSTVNRLIERYKSKGLQSVGLDKLGGGTSRGGRSRFGFDFGISHLRPEVGVEYEVGRNSFKLSVSGTGQAGFRYRHPRWGGSQVSVGYDGDEVYYLSWHVGGF